ncbi:DUF550 domain-containing protein [Salmonella enterica]
MTTITKEWLQQTIAEFENTRDDIPFGLDDDDAKILIVLKRALASLEREQIRREHAEWSDATFGDVGPIGPLKHLSKEALEAAAEPDDLSEWADMQFLLWDAQRRAGISDEQITQAMVEKLAVNKQREWPEPKDGEPRLHIKEQPAPVMPVVQCPFPCGWDSLNELVVQDAAVVVRGLVDGEVVTEANRQAVIANNDRLLRVIAACRAAMLQSKYRDLSQPVDPQISEYEKIMLQAGNSPVIPDGYTLVPVEPTDEMIEAAMNCEDVLFNSDESFCVQYREIYCAMVDTAPALNKGEY